MRTKLITLKNITTEVPEDAHLLDNPLSQLKPGDFILEIWDNPRFPAGIETNSRTFGQVHNIDQEAGRLTIGGHFHEAKQYNASTCTYGISYPNRDRDLPFPHVYFFLRAGTLPRPVNPPNLYKNPRYDLINC